MTTAVRQSFDEVRETYNELAKEVIGRHHELTAVLAAVSAGRDLLLEGPPGTSKSTILRSITTHYTIPFVLVEGNADLTPAKMLGYHNPAAVVRFGYRTEDFVYGPLPQAMRDGGFLYIEEFNRVPEDTLNTLLTAMAEREVTIPRVGTVAAAPTFRIVAAMNPFDNVGTARISISIYDRLCRLAMGYQPEDEEVRIVERRAESPLTELNQLAVAITRQTRRHPDVRAGASVRGAIDLVLVARQLATIKGYNLNEGSINEGSINEVLLEAACLALSSKIAVSEISERTPEEVIREIVGDVAPSVVAQ